MKWLISVFLASLSLPCTLEAKGLDKLQADTEDNDAKEIVDKNGKPLEAMPGTAKPVDGAEIKKTTEKERPKPVPIEPEIPVEPGFQDWYLGTSLAWIAIDGAEGDWNSSSTGDLELAYRFTKKYRGTYDLYATFRYRPADVTIQLDRRAYRGILESYLGGAKGQIEFMPKLFLLASAEMGLARTSVSSIDGIPKVDGSLEKSGVDLVFGAGVSYLVLDKIALGSQLHLGLGTHKSAQFGFDIRFLL